VFPVSAARQDLAVYVHWPFCLSKCPYCDFNSHVREAIDEARWKTALLAEIDFEAAGTPGHTVTSIFFGGGTPSLMSPGTVAAAIERIAEHWTLAKDTEITLEANPTSVEAERLRDFKVAGVNRASLGVQSLDDEALTFLGRGHSAAEALAAVELAGETFERYSFDLIYARPGQTTVDWEHELLRALDFAGDHLSVYQLTIEPGTPFHALHRDGEIVTPDDAASAELYEATQRVLGDAGLPAYEISNHARPGAESRHNLTYWRYGEYVGVGPGAHGRISRDGTKFATHRVASPERWLADVEARGHGMHDPVALGERDRLVEMLIMGLRLTDGIPIGRFRFEFGRPPEEILDRSTLDELAAGGFLVLDDRGLRASQAGRQRLDALLRRLLD
jgi:oxygen-independent coproporphyrinogen-3 oxidase